MTNTYDSYGRLIQLPARTSVIRQNRWRVHDSSPTWILRRCIFGDDDAPAMSVRNKAPRYNKFERPSGVKVPFGYRS